MPALRTTRHTLHPRTGISTARMSVTAGPISGHG